MATLPDNSKPTTGRYWSRFSLRTLFLIVTTFAIVLVIALAMSDGLRKRWRLTSELRALGAMYVAFDHNNDVTFVSFAGTINSPQISQYQSLRDVDLANSSVQDDDLKYLVGLKHLESVHLTNTAIGDAGL